MSEILSAHITHKSVDISQLELIGSQNTLYLLHAIRKLDGVKECVVLKTCNRVELYTASENLEASRKALETFVNGFVPFDSDENLVMFLSGKESVMHLLRVSSGLESMIIGEDQIQSQVKAAFELAEKEETIGPMLSVVFRKAINVGKKVRSETALNKGSVSIGSAAVELAENRLGTLAGKNVMVIGAGEMATLIAKHLIGKQPKTVFVSNKTYSRAVELAWALNGKAVRFESMVEFLSQADVVLVATSAKHLILTKLHLWKAMRDRQHEMLIIDVSFPRNVDPEITNIKGVQLQDIDGLRDLAKENILKRKMEIVNAERIIATELSLLEKKMTEMKVSELVSSLYRKFDSIKEKEVEKAVNRMHSNDEDLEKILDDFADSLIYKFLSDPTEVLKDSSLNGEDQILEAVRELFKVEGDNCVSRKKAEKVANAAHAQGHGARNATVG